MIIDYEYSRPEIRNNNNSNNKRKHDEIPNKIEWFKLLEYTVWDKKNENQKTDHCHSIIIINHVIFFLF